MYIKSPLRSSLVSTGTLPSPFDNQCTAVTNGLMEPIELHSIPLGIEVATLVKNQSIIIWHLQLFR